MKPTPQQIADLPWCAGRHQKGMQGIGVPLSARVEEILDKREGSSGRPPSRRNLTKGELTLLSEVIVALEEAGL